MKETANSWVMAATRELLIHPIPSLHRTKFWNLSQWRSEVHFRIFIWEDSIIQSHQLSSIPLKSLTRLWKYLNQPIFILHIILFACSNDNDGFYSSWLGVVRVHAMSCCQNPLGEHQNCSTNMVIDWIAQWHHVWVPPTGCIEPALHTVTFTIRYCLIGKSQSFTIIFVSHHKELLCGVEHTCSLQEWFCIKCKSNLTFH